ncbi:MAG: DNA polymerase III subunit delta' [Candidatus Cloacimonadaceae bacterium]|nr:DNA polymerase III subunit delta' [Candidatus Cloacimonadaceae bacterium]MDP3114205.1 DNA polymerase III subunit delta' [Candidatus Cloacimonadaceae bacterium]
MFRNIKGQDHALQILSTAIDNDRIAQAYLFHGMSGVGKFTTALYFGMALNCLSKNEFRPCGVCSSCHKFLCLDHPDFIYVFPTPNLQLTAEGEIKKKEVRVEYEAFFKNKIESPWLDFYFSSGTEIRKDSIAGLIRRLEISSYEAIYRVCIVEDAEMMNIPTANSFLKTLEEPPKNTVIILVTNRLSMLLPTIQSRCQPIYFKPLTRGVIEQLLRDKFDAEHALARTASRIANGSVKNAVRMLQGSAGVIRELAFELFDLAYRDQEYAFLNFSLRIREQLNAAFLADLISCVAFIVSDICIFGNNPEEITNVDKYELYKALKQDEEAFSEAAPEFLIALEDLKRKIDGNVNQYLILVGLFMRFRKLFRDTR